MASSPPSDDEYEIPLRDQRYFGAGLKRKRINFVPATSTVSNQASGSASRSGAAVAAAYLAIVMKKDAHKPQEPLNPEKDTPTDEENPAEICSVCKHAILDSHHDSTMTHRKHLPPPQSHWHIDRTRKSLAILQAQGWDPDSGKGLGKLGAEGRLYPVKITNKYTGRAGLGSKLASVKEVVKKEKLDAGKARQKYADDRKKAQELRNIFYGSDDVERHLGITQTTPTLDDEAFKRAKTKR
nr:hypothetical protein CFP56_73662 [Quercus suber]